VHPHIQPLSQAGCSRALGQAADWPVFFSDSGAARCGEAAALGLVTSSAPSEAQGASEYHTPWVCVARSYL